MGSKASRDLPYKASWTRLRYTIPPGQGSCIRDEDVITEKVEVMNIRVLPSDTSLPATLTPDGDEIANSNTELVHLEHLPEHLPEHSETVGPLSEEEDGAPVRRRATFGELCQLLALFTALGLLHYVSMRWAARWWSPQVERPRRTAQCEE
ncbi:hypothetical protein FRC12_023882 [Ceratobasidium sp. 428]|nr:hypothetical protein FRC12_023882 [Ceratobasidium sp. 428]